MPVRPPRSSLPIFKPLIPPHVSALAARIPRPQLLPSAPFFRLEGHRAPTRALYRQLLRATRSSRSKQSSDIGGRQHDVSLATLREELGSKKVLELRPWVVSAGMPAARRAKKAEIISWLVEHRSAIPPAGVSNLALSPIPSSFVSSAAAASSSDGGFPFIRQWLADAWRGKKGLTSIPLARAFLEKQYNLLSQLLSEPPATSITQLEDRLAAKAARRAAYLASQAEQGVTSHGRLTGGFLRPTIFNGPLPRIKPQPLGLSMMIHNRLRARERRQASRRMWVEHIVDMRHEVDFLFGLGVRTGGWGTAMQAHIATLDEKYKGEHQRSERRFEEGMVRRVKRARARRTRWQQEQARKRKEAEALLEGSEGQ